PPVNALTTRMSPYLSVPAGSVSVHGVPGLTKLRFLDGSVGLTRQPSGPGLAATCVASVAPFVPTGSPVVVNGQPLLLAQAPLGDSAAGFWRNQNAVFSSPLLLVRSPPK